MIRADSDKDLFEDTRMSFGEHLEDLRKTLFKAAIGLAIGCALGFMVANHVVAWLNRPLVEAIGEYRVNKAQQDMVARLGYVPSDLQPWLHEEGFIPRSIRVDPAQLVEAIRQAVPEFGAGVDADPWKLTPRHLPMASVIEVSRQLSGESNPSPATTALWQLLNESQQERIESVASKSESGEAAVADRDAVLAVLNEALSLDALREAPAFEESLAQPSATIWTLFQRPDSNPLHQLNKTLETTQGDAREKLLRQMNRSLIGNMLFTEMPVPRKTLVSIDIWEPNTFQPQSLAATDGFFIWLKAGIVTGICLSFPWVFYCIWEFVAAGLYPSEKQYVHYFMPISTLLFLSGIMLAYFFVFAPVLSFLFSFNAQLGIAPEMRINDWLSFVLFLPLGFGLAFQLPLVMLFMNRINLFTIDAYLSKWRIAVMIIFVLSMILTPADPISMLLLAIPLTFLYFLGIVMCRYMPGYNPNPFGDAPIPEV